MKISAILIIVAAAIIGFAIMLPGNGENSNNVASVNNVSVVDGTQIIRIKAKGGYSPRVTTARANMPTVIKVDTRGTFDCSSALSIPSLGFRNNLPPSGETSIEVPPQKSGSVLQVLCAMGMYNFQVRFN